MTEWEEEWAFFQLEKKKRDLNVLLLLRLSQCLPNVNRMKGDTISSAFRSLTLDSRYHIYTKEPDDLPILPHLFLYFTHTHAVYG